MASASAMEVASASVMASAMEVASASAMASAIVLASASALALAAASLAATHRLGKVQKSLRCCSKKYKD
jgi:hypothetical protein